MAFVKFIVLSLFVMSQHAFAQTILLEPGEKYSVGNQEIVCKAPQSEEKSITCRFTLTVRNGYYGTVSRLVDINATNKSTLNALSASCKDCLSRAGRGSRYDDSCSFDECFEAETGKVIYIDHNMKRLLPNNCR